MQELIVGILLVGALAFLAKRAYDVRTKKKSGCSKCDCEKTK